MPALHYKIGRYEVVRASWRTDKKTTLVILTVDGKSVDNLSVEILVDVQRSTGEALSEDRISPDTAKLLIDTFDAEIAKRLT